MDLTPSEQRVLGSLIEKQMTTPETYPLTINSLVTACNQSSNRYPVMSLAESEVLDAVSSLRELDLVRSIKRAGDRVMKHRHDVDTVLGLSDEQAALVAVLLLRGAQTPGELRSRTERYVTFDSTTAVEDALGQLTEDEDHPLVLLRERRPGEKEARWVHLLGESVTAPEPDSAATPRRDRLADLEEQVVGLASTVESLATELAALKDALGVD